MPCKHQKYTATRLSGIFVFASPYKYDTSDLVQALKDSLNPSGDEFKSLRKDILYSIKNHTDQTFLRKMDDNDHERLSLKSLDLIFSRFNAYFFKNTLPQDTRIVRKSENNISILPGFSLPFKAASSSGIFAAATRIVHTSTPEIDRTKSPCIIIPSKGTSSTNSSPGDDVSALLESMIGLYLRWYSCQKPSCLNKFTACGKGGRGHAWQKIANLLERSEMMSDMQTLIGSQGTELFGQAEDVGNFGFATGIGVDCMDCGRFCVCCGRGTEKESYFPSGMVLNSEEFHSGEDIFTFMHDGQSLITV
ncbi:hypothetical protein BGAL_0073g00070 [Botrytis galanthina]|uniref:Uncharacterized protein n=1 Tax=Botrytis galanthina TaxID=278940 RepID=A0A4S8R445_9HELO|nr:hypothetical protein BGAL_0073g00070 [Botrytis galanthina]